MTDQPISRQVRRANERRANKPEPDYIEPTSTRWIGRTKGQPYSRCVLKDVKLQLHGPAKMLVEHPTRPTSRKSLRATPRLVDLFYPTMPENFRNSLLGY